MARLAAEHACGLYMNPIQPHHDGMHGMHASDELAELRQLDLNLLVALEALLKEKSVTKAASRVGLTQSAMSHALARLRGVLGDPLLVRSGKGLDLTPRGAELELPLRASMVELARLIASPQHFDAGETQRTFRVACPDLAALLLLPALHLQLAQLAPCATLALQPLDDRFAARLETGELDLVVVPQLIASRAPFAPKAADHLVRKEVRRDNMRVYMRKEHPLASVRRLTLPKYLAQTHLLVSPGGEGPGLVDSQLQALGHSRRLALRVGNFATAIHAMATTDLLLTAPGALRAAPGVEEGFVDFAPPLTLPDHAVALAWHPKFSLEPGHQWFRAQLLDALRARRPAH